MCEGVSVVEGCGYVSVVGMCEGVSVVGVYGYVSVVGVCGDVWGCECSGDGEGVSVVGCVSMLDMVLRTRVGEKLQ